MKAERDTEGNQKLWHHHGLLVGIKNNERSGMGGVGKKEMRSARDRALIGPSDFVSISKRRAGKGYTK